MKITLSPPGHLPEPMITDETKATLMGVLEKMTQGALKLHGVKSLAEFREAFKMQNINTLTEAGALKAIDYLLPFTTNHCILYDNLRGAT